MKLYINGEIHSMDASLSVHSALLEEDGKIRELGQNEELISKYPEAEKIDLGGKVVIPGLIDTHAHFFASAYSEKTEKVFIAKNVGELLDDLKKRVKKALPGEWIYYINTYPLRLSELRYPTFDELSEIAPQNPVVVDGYYSARLNRAALSQINLDELPPGAGVEYDKRGELTGILKCANSYLKNFADFGNGSEEASLINLMHEYNKCGITTCIDAMTSPDNIRSMKKLQDEGKQNIRIRYTLPAVSEVLEKGKGTDAGNPEFARVEFAKNFLDGGFLTGTAFMEYPYKNVEEVFSIDTKGKDEYGMVLFSEDELAEKIRLARSFGLRYGAHCVGSAATKRLIRAYEKVNAEKSIEGEGHALIHADFADAKMIEAANDMGLYLLFQPAWHYMDAPSIDKVLDERDTSRFMQYDVILKAHLAAAGSDHMIKHDPDESVNPYNPFLGMYNMITLRARDGKAYGKPCVSRDIALAAYTRNAARATRDEEIIGTLEAGKRADFTALNKNYFTCKEEEIPEIRADMTVVEGKRVI